MKRLPGFEEEAFRSIASWRRATLHGQQLSQHTFVAVEAPLPERLELSVEDQAVLQGAEGLARQKALAIVARMARLQRAERLVDVAQVHIDACTYIGPASLRFAEKLLEWGARLRVPSTLNAISLDLSREVTEEGKPAKALAEDGRVVA